MVWVCLTCKGIVKVPIEEINVVTAPNGTYYHAGCAIGKLLDGKFVLLDYTRGQMEAKPGDTPTGNSSSSP